MPQHDHAEVLVIGATGTQGGAVAHALLGAGHRVTALVRDPSSDRARALAERGVALAQGDLDDVASLEAALSGQDVVFSLQMPPGEDPGSEERQARDLVAAARRAGVRQVFHTSVSATGWRDRHPDVDPGLMKTYWDGKEGAEEAVRSSGLETWTILKPAFYMENFLPPKVEHTFPHLAEGQLLTAASPDTLLALVAAEDLGAAVVAAVADPGSFHESEVEFAGDALTYSEIAAALSEAADRDITAVHLPADEVGEHVGPGLAASQVWLDHIGYPARPHHAARHGLTTTTFEQWAGRQDWSAVAP